MKQKLAPGGEYFDSFHDKPRLTPERFQEIVRDLSRTTDLITLIQQHTVPSNSLTQKYELPKFMPGLRQTHLTLKNGKQSLCNGAYVVRDGNPLFIFAGHCSQGTATVSTPEGVVDAEAFTTQYPKGIDVSVRSVGDGEKITDAMTFPRNISDREINGHVGIIDTFSPNNSLDPSQLSHLRLPVIYSKMTPAVMRMLASVLPTGDTEAERALRATASESFWYVTAPRNQKGESGTFQFVYSEKYHGYVLAGIMDLSTECVLDAKKTCVTLGMMTGLPAIEQLINLHQSTHLQETLFTALPRGISRTETSEWSTRTTSGEGPEILPWQSKQP